MISPVRPDSCVSGRVGWIRLLGLWGSDLNSRRWSIGIGGLTWPPFLAGVAIAGLLVLSACTSTGSGESTTSTLTRPTTSTSYNQMLWMTGFG